MMRILVEGYADRLLMLALQFSDEEVINQKGKFKLAETMLDKYRSVKVVALIDEDKLTVKTKSPFLQSFVEREGYSLPYLQCKSHPENKIHFLIVLRPKALEQWSIDAAAQAKIRLADYNLPSNSKELGRRFKTNLVEHDEAVWRFFKALVRANPPHIQTLRKWVEEIKAM
ncbi:MAG: hypothetical protein SNJ55_11670 [Chloroherpetonaceae bacterium]